MNYVNPGVYIEEVPSGARTIVGVPTSITAFIGKALCGPTDKATPIHSFTDYTRLFGGLSKQCTMGYAVNQFFQNGGADALIVRVDAGAGKEVTEQNLKGDPTAKTGLYALEDADIFNLLCIPAFDASDITRKNVYEAAAALCEKKRAILLVDPSKQWTTKDAAQYGIKDYVTKSKNASIYFPRLKAIDAVDQTLRDFDPCGAVAGVIARTDTQRGVWKSPAGIEANLIDISDLTVQLSDSDNGDLNLRNINCLRKMASAGLVIWGAHTLSADAEWKYLPIRRLALYLEESLFRGTQWAVFEPNNEQLWAQIRLNVGAFMQNLWRAGAFQGTDPRHAHFVKCDSETTTQTDVELGYINIVVGFAPLKPAEFIIVKIQIKQDKDKTHSVRQRLATKPPITSPKYLNNATLGR